MSKYEIPPQLVRATMDEFRALVSENKISLQDAQRAFADWQRMETHRLHVLNQSPLYDYNAMTGRNMLREQYEPRGLPSQSRPLLVVALSGLDDMARGGSYTMDGWQYDGYRKAAQYVHPQFGAEQWDFFCRIALPERIRSALIGWQEHVETAYLLGTHGKKLNWPMLTNAVRDIPMPDDLECWPMVKQVCNKPWWLMHHVETLRLLAVEHDLEVRRAQYNQTRDRAARMEMDALLKRSHKLKPQQR